MAELKEGSPHFFRGGGADTLEDTMSHAKYEQSPLVMPVSLLFHNIGPNLVQILPL